MESVILGSMSPLRYSSSSLLVSEPSTLVIFGDTILQGLLTVKPDQGYSSVSSQFGFDFNGWTVQTSLMGNKASMFCVAPIVPDSWLPLNETNPTNSSSGQVS